MEKEFNIEDFNKLIKSIEEKRQKKITALDVISSSWRIAVQETPKYENGGNYDYYGTPPWYLMRDDAFVLNQDDLLSFKRILFKNSMTPKYSDEDFK